MDMALIPKSLFPVWEALNRRAPTYLVGGAVRDLCRGVVPHDWDLATALHPDEVQQWGHQAKYRVIPSGLDFGTVTIMTELGPVEVTTFRRDGRYADGRHPQTVTFSKDLEEDLSRRDFTMNAMGLHIEGILVDPFHGLRDLSRGLIAPVGDPRDRFTEDPLRMFRAVRFTGLADSSGQALQLDPSIMDAIGRYKALIAQVSGERHQQELWKLLDTPHFATALRVLSTSGLLGVIWPEWVATQGFDQKNPYHRYALDEHLLKTAEHGPTPTLRLVGLLHDIAKPSVFWMDSLSVGHFYGHDDVGAKYVRHMLNRMAMAHDTIDRVAQLIQYHMFNWDAAGDKAIRRLIRTVGISIVQDLLSLRAMDIEGAGRSWPEEDLVRERFGQLSMDLSARGARLALDGNDVLHLTGVTRGPRVGYYLRQLEDWVDEDPTRNTFSTLEQQLIHWVQKEQNDKRDKE